jgi:tetratricopeptide (TPR) repeat protein
VALAGEDWAAAVDDLRAALKEPGATELDPGVHLQLAQAQLALGEPRAALDTLTAAPPALQERPQAALVLAQAAWACGRGVQAFDTLQAGERAHPAEPEFLRQQALLLATLQLYQPAAEVGSRLLSRGDARPEDVLLLAETLRRAGQTEQALLVLDQGLLRFPDYLGLRVQAAGVALAADRPRVAAGQLEVVAAADPEYADEAAEAWRRAGELSAALRLNSQVVDPLVKGRQRLGLLLEAEAWESAAALQERLDRLGLIEEGPVAYGLAYARFQAGDWARAEDLLDRIVDPATFRLAAGLRAALREGRERGAGWP